MIIKNFFVRISWKILIAIAATSGIAISFGIGYGQFFPKMFFFFTILSSLLVAVYFWVDWGYLLRDYTTNNGNFEPGTLGTSEPALAVKHTALFGIILTGVVANTLLVGQMAMNDWRDIWVDLLLHKITPMMVFLDFIFCEKHGKLKLSHPFLSIIFPVCYFIFAEIIVNVTRIDMNEDDLTTMYPYQFLDPALQGIDGVVIIVCVIAAAYVVTGLIFFAIDKLLAKIK